MFMVQFTSSEGRPSHHMSETLDEAVRFVERLRNAEGVEDSRVFEMTEVPIEVKTYYRVQVGSPSTVSASLPTLEVGVSTNSESAESNKAS